MSADSASDSTKNVSSNAPNMPNEDKDNSVTLESPFPKVINMFDGEKDCSFCFPDLLVCFDNMKLRLHRPLLSNASDLMYGVLSCNSKSCKKSKRKTEEDDDEDAIEYTFIWEFNATKEVDKDALIAALRYCYGENIVLKAENCELNCALFAAVMRLQVKCLDALITKMTDFILRNAERDVSLGARLLKACNDYMEMKQEGVNLDRKIAERVLTTERLHGYFPITVIDCLFLLPPYYLDLAHYGVLHSPCSEFGIRTGYITANGDLDKEKKIKILKKVKPEELNSTELQTLVALKLFSNDELLHYFRIALISREKIHSDQERVCGSTLFAKLIESRAAASAIVTGTNSADTCGALYFAPKHCIMRTTSTTPNPGKDMILTTLTSATAGTNEVKENVIPFKCSNHPPVFDGRLYAYFMQDTTEASGNRFGRLDLDKLTFTELKTLPSDKFGAYFSGCYHHGRVFTVKNNAEIWSYDPATNAWQNCGVNAPNHDENQCVRLLSDPEDDADHIYAMGIQSKNGLHRIDLNDHTINLVSAPETVFSILRDAILLRIDATEFAVIASLDGGVWYAYSSKNNKWKRLYQWEPTPTAVTTQNTLVYAGPEHTLYYHVQGANNWSAVQIDAGTFA